MIADEQGAQQVCSNTFLALPGTINSKAFFRAIFVNQINRKTKKLSFGI